MDGHGSVYDRNRYRAYQPPEEILTAISLVFNRLAEAVPSLEEYTGAAEYRAYKFVPSQIWINHDEEKNGKTIDSRIEIKITPTQK